MIEVYSAASSVPIKYFTQNIQIDEQGRLRIFKEESTVLYAIWAPGAWERIEWT